MSQTKRYPGFFDDPERSDLSEEVGLLVDYHIMETNKLCILKEFAAMKFHAQYLQTIAKLVGWLNVATVTIKELREELSKREVA